MQPPPGNRSSDHQLIGFAAAAQSAQQVAGLLGGPPSNDRRVQDQLNELLASKSRPELWEVLRLLKEFLGGDRAAARSYFAERPALAKAVFQAQVLLGELQSCRCGSCSCCCCSVPRCSCRRCWYGGPLFCCMARAGWVTSVWATILQLPCSRAVMAADVSKSCSKQCAAEHREREPCMSDLADVRGRLQRCGLCQKLYLKSCRHCAPVYSLGNLKVCQLRCIHNEAAKRQ